MELYFPPYPGILISSKDGVSRFRTIDDLKSMLSESGEAFDAALRELEAKADESQSKREKRCEYHCPWY